MKHALLVLFLGWCSLQAECQTSVGKNYYVDCSADRDGIGSKKRPWNTLASINSFTFKPGDVILFKRGTKAIGELWPKGSGNENAQITIDAYGTGANPIVDAQGAENSAGIRLSNQEYWTIQNMEVINNSPTLGKRWGIYVVSNDSLVKHRIRIKNNIVHNVFASYIRDRGGKITTFYDVGGIYVKVFEPGSMDDVLIEGNELIDIVGVGICFWGESEMEGRGMNWNNLSPHVVVRSNTVIRTGADGILVLGTDDELIEYNRVDNAGYHGKIGDVPGKLGKNGTDAIAGLWPTRHRNGLVQYNEVSNTHRFYGDGQAFDNDMYVTGSTIFQYNYSHNNEGGFFLDCCRAEKTNTGTIVRFNISQNDGEVEYLGFGKGIAIVYNNIFYTEDSIRINGLSNNVFYNNIFWAKDGIWHDKVPSVIKTGVNIFEHNSYYGGMVSPVDSNKITTNPMFVKPGSGTIGFKSLEGYKLLNGSPLIKIGKPVINSVKTDFWGNPVTDSSAPNIGAYNGKGN